MSIRDWSDFFVAVAGAGAALAGLIIVAISVNVRRILDIPGMAERGATTVSSLVLVVIVACAGLMPFQPLAAFGAESAVAAVVTLAIAARSTAVFMRHDTHDSRLGAAAKGGLGLLPGVLVFAGSLLACAGDSAGIGVVAAGILVCVAASSINAWVLLVEILR